MNRTFGVKGRRTRSSVLAIWPSRKLEASLLTEHLVALHGDEGLRRLLSAYSGGAKDADAFAKPFSQTVDRVDASFKAFVEKEYGALARAMADTRPPLSERLNRHWRVCAPGRPRPRAATSPSGRGTGADRDWRCRSREPRSSALAWRQWRVAMTAQALLAELAVKQGDAAGARAVARELLTWDPDN